MYPQSGKVVVINANAGYLVYIAKESLSRTCFYEIVDFWL